MPPKRAAAANGRRNSNSTNGSTKRKATDEPPSSPSSSTKKQVKTSHGGSDEPHSYGKDGFVLREFYPAEMSIQRANEYKNGTRTLPIQELEEAVTSTQSARDKISLRRAVIHWFKCDLRTSDNTSLCLASQKAKQGNVPLIALYIVSPQDFEAHNTSAVRVDFILRTLKVLKNDLAKLDIPLYVETVDTRQTIPSRIIELAREWDASHIFTNVEYEVDELRREANLTNLCLENDISFTPLPDTCVVAPGELKSGAGNQFAVYTPWYRTWLKYIHTDKKTLNLREKPAKNPSSAKADYKTLFESKIPETPLNRALTAEQKKRFGALWPAGEHEAKARMHKFVKEKIHGYADNRNLPSVEGTSRLSVHLAAGTISARQVVREATEKSSSNKLDGGDSGTTT
jgi:deoxyribodipyrimidine photo-lyase